MISLQKHLPARGVIIELIAEEAKTRSRKDKRGFEIISIDPDSRALLSIDSEVNLGHTSGIVTVRIGWRLIKAQASEPAVEVEEAQIPWYVAAA